VRGRATVRSGFPTFLQVLFCAPLQIFFQVGSLSDVGAVDCAPKRGAAARVRFGREPKLSN
jgi:hypothetical protein